MILICEELGTAGDQSPDSAFNYLFFWLEHMNLTSWKIFKLKKLYFLNNLYNSVQNNLICL